MNCSEAEQLCSYGRDHSLSERQRSVLEEHLAHCAACRRREHSYEDLLKGFRAQTAEIRGRICCNRRWRV